MIVAAAVLAAGLLLPYVGGLGLAARHESAKFLNTTCNLQETQPPQPTHGLDAISPPFKRLALGVGARQINPDRCLRL